MMTIAEAAAALGGEVAGGQVLAPGPGHSAADRSLSVKLTPGGILVYSHAGDDQITCLDYVREKLGLPKFKAARKPNGRSDWKFVREHIYRNADGTPHARKRKYLKPDGGREFPWANWIGGSWVNGKPKAHVLYRLPELIAAPETSIVYVTEGEADADALAALGFVATTAGGVSETKPWTKPEFIEPLKDRRVVVVVDSDTPGRKYGPKVAKALDAIAESLKLVDLFPDDVADRDGRDISEFLKSDRAGVKFIKAVNEAPLWEPKPEAEGDKPDGKAGGTAGDKPKAKQADVLLALSESAEELFHTPDATAFATIPVGDHLENWPVRSKGFRRWLAREFFTKEKSAANSDAMQSALNVIEARAHFDGVEREVYVRVGACNGRLYLDLADRRWRAVEISTDGWRIIDRAPVAFRRPAGMRTLPDPIAGGSINDLRPFLNINDDKDDGSFVLAVCFTLAALRERGPYPALCLAGEHGAAKSTFTAVLRRLIDPNSAPLRALPREDRDLFIAANNAHLLAFDNVSHLPDWISDTLCRLATGGGFATRQLYSDQDEALFDAMRPVILNGIEDVVVRPDLADRSLFLNLQNIADDKRKEEGEFWSEFDAAHPRILGALLDGVACGLRQLPTTKLAKMPRMADFAKWSAACETKYWKAGTFAQAYGQNRADAVSAVIEADVVAACVQTFMAERPDLKQQKQSSLLSVDVTQWTGTAADLLGALKMAVGEEKAKQKEWPSTPRALSSRLRRAAGTLRKVGVEITFDREPGGKRRTISLKEKVEHFASQPSLPSQANDINSLDRDANCDANGEDGACVTACVTAKPLKNKDCDGSDGCDANLLTQSDGTADCGDDWFE